MHKEKRSHRETRLQIINEWADKGVQEPRTLFSTERSAFASLHKAAQHSSNL